MYESIRVRTYCPLVNSCVIMLMPSYCVHNSQVTITINWVGHLDESSYSETPFIWIVIVTERERVLKRSSRESIKWVMSNCKVHNCE